LENKAIKNPYLRQSIEASKRLLYESWHQNLAIRHSSIN
jgi:hypothetical protein